MKHSIQGLVRHEGRYRLSVAHLLIAIVALFVVLPFVDRFFFGKFVESLVFTAMLLAAVNAVGGQRRTQVVAGLLMAPALVSRWLDHFWPGLLPVDLSLYLAIIFVVFVIAHLLRFVIAAPTVTAEVLCAAISVYLLFAVVWAFVYTLLASWDHGAFTFSDPTEGKSGMAGFTALYFSVQILTTITFGDILPVSNVARMVAIVEAAAGVFYLAIMIARLVGLYSSQPPTEEVHR